VAATIVTMREQETAAAEEQRQQSDESGLGDIGEMASAAATRAAGHIPVGLLLSLLGGPTGSAQALARGLVRHMPLVLLLALIALLFWPMEEETEQRPGDEEGEAFKDQPNDRPPAANAASIREAA
jgi:hypothetical protein